MAGLREKNRKRNEKSIFNAASMLIRQKGYRNTSMGDIAESAGVAVGTLYNYYGSKFEILAAYVHHEIDAGFDRDADTGDFQNDDPVTVFQKMFKSILVKSMELIPEKEIWRELTAAVFISTESYMKEHYRKDLELLSRMSGLVAGFQKTGRVSRGVSPDDVVMILISIYKMKLMEYLILDVPLEETIRQIMKYVEISFKGFLPEKE